jgi:hypothetical protein
MLNVCVEPALEIAKSVPAVPVANVCVDPVKVFNVVIELAGVCQVAVVALVAVSTWFKEGAAAANVLTEPEPDPIHNALAVMLFVLDVNVLLVSVSVVVTNPRAVADALGMLNVCVETELEIAKSVPAVPVANVCVAAVNVLSVVIVEMLSKGILRLTPLITHCSCGTLPGPVVTLAVLTFNANEYVVLLTDAPLPIATPLRVEACAPYPIAIAEAALTFALLPIATESAPVAYVLHPIATV